MSNTGSYSAVFTRGQSELRTRGVASSSRRAPHSASARDAPALVASRARRIRARTPTDVARRGVLPLLPLPALSSTSAPPPPARRHRARSSRAVASRTRRRGYFARRRTRRRPRRRASARGRRRSRGRRCSTRARAAGRRTGARSRCARSRRRTTAGARARRGPELVTDLTRASVPSYRSPLSDGATSARALGAHERPRISLLTHVALAQVFLPLAYHYPLPRACVVAGHDDACRCRPCTPRCFRPPPSAAFATHRLRRFPPRPPSAPASAATRTASALVTWSHTPSDARTTNELRTTFGGPSAPDRRATPPESPSAPIRRRKRRRQRKRRAPPARKSPRRRRGACRRTRGSPRGRRGAARGAHARRTDETHRPARGRTAPPARWMRRRSSSRSGLWSSLRSTARTKPDEDGFVVPRRVPGEPTPPPEDYSVSARQRDPVHDPEDRFGCRRRWRTRRRRRRAPPRRRCIRSRGAPPRSSATRRASANANASADARRSDIPSDATREA